MKEVLSEEHRSLSFEICLSLSRESRDRNLWFCRVRCQKVSPESWLLVLAVSLELVPKTVAMRLDELLVESLEPVKVVKIMVMSEIRLRVPSLSQCLLNLPVSAWNL